MRKVAGAARAKENPSCCGNGAVAQKCGGDVCGCPTGSSLECQGSIVQGSALARPQANAPISFSLIDCRPPVYITCPAHGFFQVDPDTRLIYFFDFATCAWEADPSPGSG